MPHRACAGTKVNGEDVGCCFSTWTALEAAQGRYDGRCVWCNPTEIARRCGEKRLRKLLVTDLRKLWQLHPRSYDAALARLPEKWRTQFQEQLEEAGPMAPGTAPAHPACLLAPAAPPAPPAPPAPVERRGFKRLRVVIEDNENTYSNTPTASQHAKQAPASQRTRDSHGLASKTRSQPARPGSS